MPKGTAAKAKRRMERMGQKEKKHFRRPVVPGEKRYNVELSKKWANLSDLQANLLKAEAMKESPSK